MSTVTDPTQSSFCEGVEKGHSSHSAQASIAKSLGITVPSVQMDSQAKYASISRGVGEIYLRLPTSMEYEERIWVRISFPLSKGWGRASLTVCPGGYDKGSRFGIPDR